MVETVILESGDGERFELSGYQSDYSLTGVETARRVNTAAHIGEEDVEAGGDVVFVGDEQFTVVQGDIVEWIHKRE